MCFPLLPRVMSEVEAHCVRVGNGATMKAAVLYRYGGPEELQYEDFPDPVPGPGEVLVKVAAAGINPVDMHEISGATKDWRPLQFPAVIGWDVSGTVTRLGTGVSDLAVGDRVAAWAYRTFAELVVARADLFAKVPAKLDLVDAAAVPLVALTGSQLISMASGIKPGDSVIVSGAAGGVGRSAVYMAKRLGGTVIAGVLQRQLGQAQSIGAHQTVALDDAAALAALPEVDIVANCVRGPTASALMGKVKAGGTFASVTGPPDNATEYPAVKVVSFVSKQNGAQLRELLEAAAAGELTIPIDRRIPLQDAATGEAAVSSGATGKVVLVP
jgi:NADPH:quinone reductase-like Zn-dependent oxidoreductase